MQQGIVCPKCGVQNTPGQGFCAACGTQLQQNCANCSSAVDASAKFCPFCGSGMGWGMRFKEIQSQVTQAENGLRGLMTQNMNDLQGQLVRTEDGMKSVLGQYSESIHAQQILMNETAQHIEGLIAEEHSLSLSKRINRIGMGIIALGLAVIGLSYVIGNAATIALFGVGGVAVGLILQLISSFIKVKPRYANLFS